MWDFNWFQRSVFKNILEHSFPRSRTNHTKIKYNSSYFKIENLALLQISQLRQLMPSNFYTSFVMGLVRILTHFWSNMSPQNSAFILQLECNFWSLVLVKLARSKIFLKKIGERAHICIALLEKCTCRNSWIGVIFFKDFLQRMNKAADFIFSKRNTVATGII